MSTTAMRERSIILGTHDIRALQDGRKSQIRFPVNPQPEAGADNPYIIGSGFDSKARACPYGRKGDRLWVKEKWNAAHFSIDPETGYADDCHVSHDVPPGSGSGYWTAVYASDERFKHADAWDLGWRSSTHMPRWASRFTLEITNTRIQQLKDMTKDDAIAEGLPRLGSSIWLKWKDYSGRLEGYMSAQGSYRTLWELTRGEWRPELWVWVVSFKRI